MFGFKSDAAKQASKKAIEDTLRAAENAEKAKREESLHKMKLDVVKDSVIVTTGDLNCEYDILGVVQAYGWNRTTVDKFFGPGGGYYRDYELILKEQAFNIGGDAVVGVKINLECASIDRPIYNGRTTDSPLMELYIEHWYGTAVKIKDKEE